VDGDYTFYAYGDDVTILLVDDVEVSNSAYWDSFGNVFANTPVSGPVSLTQGDTKKILLKFKEGSGTDFSWVGIQISPTNPIASHPNKKVPTVVSL